MLFEIPEGGAQLDAVAAASADGLCDDGPGGDLVSCQSCSKVILLRNYAGFRKREASFLPQHAVYVVFVIVSVYEEWRLSDDSKATLVGFQSGRCLEWVVFKKNGVRP